MEFRLFKILICCCMTFLTLSGRGQLSLESTKFDFGELRRADPNWTDFELVNRSGKTAHIFRMDVPKHIEVQFSTKTIEPDSAAIIRISISPTKEGTFKEKLMLHASAWNEPKEIVISGEAMFVANGLIPCPDFSTSTASRLVDFHISVLSAVDDSKLDEAEILVFQNGERKTQSRTDKYGEASFPLSYGPYMISARRNGEIIDTTLYVNAINNHLILELDPGPERNTPIAAVEKEEPITSNLETVETVESPVVEDQISAEPVYAELPADLYRQNNLVFLVDVSTSMKKNGKLDLLKVAMIDLLEVLRPYDRFALISYSTETHTLIQTQQNLDRAACKSAIQALQAGGSTEGAKAIDHAGRMAIKHFVEAGNNQILLATDGAFNEAIDKAKKIVGKYNRRNVTLSVIGIKCGPFTTKQMTELAELGDGTFIPLSDSQSAGSALLNEVKRSALK